jgi:hypothetical protein
MRKAKTLAQVAAMQKKAVRFVSDVLDEPEHAEEIEELSPEEYAERKRIRITNPREKRGLNHMAVSRPSRSKLEERIEELEQENEALTEKLDSILDIASTDDASDDEDDD